MEDLLSITEIKQVNAEAEKLKLLKRNVIYMGLNKSDVLNISQQNDLILVFGNSDTGYKHILERHGFRPYTLDDLKFDQNGKAIISRPSQFKIGTVPIFDFLSIADQVYNQNQLNVKDNSNREAFDLFEGTANYSDIINQRIRLIMYKGTKIIHTLFPITKNYNKLKAKGFSFIQGQSSGEFKTMSDLTIIKTPYFNYSKVIRYILIKVRIGLNNKEKVSIQVNDKEGHPQFTFLYLERNVNDAYKNVPQLMIKDFVDDLRDIEKQIMKLENELIEKRTKNT
jgi:hypothetical protein